MADQEVIKHTKKVYKIWNSREHGFWFKLREFFVEICIIVFAVTLSIWLHSWSEHRHDQQDVKTFLLGLRADLKKDIEELKLDQLSYELQHQAFSYLYYVKLGDSVRLDSLQRYINSLYNTTAFIPNNGRYEGFKSSGRMEKIEYQPIKTAILDLYQEDIANLLASTNHYIQTKNRFHQYIIENRKRINDSSTNLRAVLASDQVFNYASSLINTSQIVERYQVCIDRMQLIVNEINEVYE